MASPKVEFLWWRECPSWERALSTLRGEMTAAGLTPDAIEITEVRSSEEAHELAFPGSPTIRVDGADVHSADEAPIGLGCRVYIRADGRVSPLPEPARIAAALVTPREESKS